VTPNTPVAAVCLMTHIRPIYRLFKLLCCQQNQTQPTNHSSACHDALLTIYYKTMSCATNNIVGPQRSEVGHQFHLNVKTLRSCWTPTSADVGTVANQRSEGRDAEGAEWAGV